MKKIRIGVMGVYRGTSMINYCKAAQNAEVVAVCDKWEEALERHKEITKNFRLHIIAVLKISFSMIWTQSFWRIMQMSMHPLRLQP